VRVKLILALLLISLPGCASRVGNWSHPVKGFIDFDADRETCLIRMSLKSGRDYSNCLYTSNCDFMISDCMKEVGWVYVERR